MRILHVTSVVGVGGAEMALLELVRHQTASGHEVEVAHVRRDTGLGDVFRDAGARVTPLGAERASSLPGAFLRLCALMRDRRPDIVHTHLLKADFLGALAARRLGLTRRLVSSKHNDESALRRRPVQWAHGIISRWAARVVALSRHVGEIVATEGRVPRDRLEVVTYGLDPAPFENARADGIRQGLGLGTDDLVAITVARFAPQKDHAGLLEAACLLRDEHPRLRWLWVGGDPRGDLQKRMERSVAERGMTDRVLFAGIRRDIPALMAASDLFVMPSNWEGLGLVYLEAMATGLPVVANRVSGVPEVVVDGITGILVERGRPGPLAEAIGTLVQDPDLRRALGMAGRQRVRECFSPEAFFSGYDRIYSEIIGP